MWYFHVHSPEETAMGYSKITALSLTDLFVQQIET